MTSKPIVLLEAWQVLMLHNRPFQLLGFATNHPRLPVFRRQIQTSHVLRLDPAKHEAETVNTLYRLRRGITDMAFDGASPVRILLEDLTAYCDSPAGAWWICGGEEILADGIPDYRMAILAMLDILDRR
jgi:hypothetical protein